MTVHPPLAGAALAGVDVGEMLDDLGLPRGLEEQPDAELSRETWEAVWEEAVRRSGDPALALRTAERMPLGSFGVVDYIASNHETVGAGLRATVEYFRFTRAGFGLRLETLDDGSVVLGRTGARPGRLRLHQYSTEFTFTTALSRFRATSGRRWNPTRATFSYPEPAHARAYTEIFGCPLSFSVGDDSLAISAETLALRQPRADSRLRQLIEQSAKVLVEHLPAASVTERLRAALPKALSDRTPAAAELARTLGMSARTLQRRLDEEGTSFQGVVDDVRFQLAQRYLADRSVAASEVAFLLGFSDVRAFSRAFKRWSGTTPTQWRRPDAPQH